MIELDKTTIQGLFDMSAGLVASRMAYIAQAEGRVQSPPVTWLEFPQANGEAHVKSGHIAGTKGFVVKIATGFYDNAQRGQPSSNGMSLLFCTQTGQPLALLKDEGWLTDMRTGLGGALATHALARSGYSNVLIVGAGLQSQHQVRCLQHLAGERPLSFQIWARDINRGEAAAKSLREDGLDVEAVSDLQTAVARADAIITITPAKAPLIQADWVRPGTHITAIGADSPGKQELSADLVAQADLLVCDLAEQSLHEGEFQTAFASGKIKGDSLVALGHVLSNAHPGRPNNQAITIADLTGLAAQDAAVALTALSIMQPDTELTEAP